MDPVRKPSAAYDQLLERWELPRDLLGGTIVMQQRAFEGKWLTREPKERYEQFRARVERSELFNAFADTLARLADQPFSRAVSVIGDLSEEMSAIEQNADKAGNTLHALCADGFVDALAYGKTHFLVDMPRLTGQENREQLRGVRPSIVHVPALSLIGWQSVQTSNGSQALSQVRILESRSEADGEFGEKSVDIVRVIDAPADIGQRGRWRLYRPVEKQSGEYVLFDEGEHTYPGVPLVTFYTRKAGFMGGRPPLEALAGQNKRHWQSSSDQSNILRFARIAQLALSGYDHKRATEDGEGAIEGFGWNQLISLPNPDSKAYFVEHSGKAIEAGENDLRAIEQRMETLGMQPMVERVTHSTATGAGINEARTMTRIQSWIRDLEDAVESCYAIAAMMIGQALPEDFRVDIFSDFSAPGRREDADHILRGRLAGELSRKTFLEEWRRRDVISQDVDIEEELDRIEREGPPVGMLDLPAADPSSAAT